MGGYFPGLVALFGLGSAFIDTGLKGTFTERSMRVMVRVFLSPIWPPP